HIACMPVRSGGAKQADPARAKNDRSDVGLEKTPASLPPARSHSGCELRKASAYSYRDGPGWLALCCHFALEENPEWIAMRDWVSPLVLQVLGYVVLRDRCATPVVAHHWMQIAAQVRARSIILCNAADRNVEGIKLVVIRTVL